jgi:hypothetical protein
MIVGGNLTLNADINMTGKGFEGGATTMGTGECASLPGRNLYIYDATSTYSGFKGEGVAITNNLLEPLFPNYAKGKGGNFNGGGGGNGKFSGGGGGGNFGSGGNGYVEVTGCEDVEAPGRGGRSILGTAIETGIFMGGGGGSSTYLAGSTACPGGRGGGIVIILADTIIGNGFSILANGEHPAVSASGPDAGAGGGGGGGSVALSITSFGSAPLTLRANGGQGGNTSNVTGSGGGGGGGRLWVNIPFPGTGITRTVSGGIPGIINYPIGSPVGDAGSPGLISNTFAVKLNGFLFNSIRSSVTTLVNDTICELQIPPKLIGTQPIGGLQPYTFLWQKSYDGVTWTDLANTEVPGLNFTPSGGETTTLRYRRTVTDSDGLVDKSREVIILVQPLISDNLIEADATICYAQDPGALIPANSGPGGGDGINYRYMWKMSTDNVLFSEIPATDSDSFDPPPLTSTTYYHRVVTSGKCTDISNPLTITVLPLIASNTIAAGQTICENDLFIDLTGSVPTGGAGAGSYTFGWLSKTGAAAWVPASGLNSGQGYDPDETEFPATQYYRRVVYSGPGDVCRDTTDAVTLLMHPEITNNTIGGNQTICYNNQPAIITGQLPAGGDGSYTYTWQDSSKVNTWTNIPGFINSAEPSFLPPVLQDTTAYRRIVISSACNNISEVTRIFVHKPVTDFGISLKSGGLDTTICSGAVPNLLKGETAAGGTSIPGDYNYTWFYSIDETNWIPVPAAGTDADYQPGSLTETTWFRREVRSGECLAVSNSIKVTVLPVIANNTLPADMMVCYNTAPALLVATPPTGGTGSFTYLWEQSTDSGSTWGNAAGLNTLKDYQPPVLTAPVSYRRVVYSGPSDCCSDVSTAISVGIHDLPTGNIVSVTDEMCRSYATITMEVTLTGAAPWNVVLNSSTDPSTVTLNSISASPYVATLSPTATSTYTILSVTDNNGCQAEVKTGSFALTMYEDPVARTNPDNSDEVCGLSYDLVPVPSVGTGTWVLTGIPVAESSDLGSGRLRVELGSGNYGTWSFWWKETNWNCKDSVKLDVRFWEMPSPVDAGPDITTTLNFVRMNAAEPSPVNTTKMQWSYPGTPADILYDDASDPLTWVRGLRLGQNTFTWTVENGKCIVEDIINVNYNPIPTGFSPDNNGLNDFFEIPGLEDTENELVIVNISGAELVRFSNYSSLTGYWDGRDRNGKDLAEGTYYYFLTITKPYQARTGGYIIIKRKINE